MCYCGQQYVAAVYQYKAISTHVDIYTTSAAEDVPPPSSLSSSPSHMRTHTLSQTCPQQSHGTPHSVPRATGLWGTESPVTLWPTRWLQAVWAHNPAQTDTLPTQSAVVQNYMLPWWWGVMSQCLLEKGQWGMFILEDIYSHRFQCPHCKKMQIAWYFLVLQFPTERLQLSASTLWGLLLPSPQRCVAIPWPIYEAFLI